ncbi:helix-turn-helix transcriptional regulator [Microbaculum sp. FT89]|uniref:helix-turn-helix transcriptional regulator n=1 Tax=Microbaculum sp. FT89 TaxID=3447298 RepID=UPI003F52B005
MALQAASASVPIRAERIESGLQARHWSLNREAAAAARQIVLLADGEGEAETDGTAYPFSAPAILWLGNARPARLRAGAGATGFLGGIGNAVLVEAIGDEPESVSLRYMVDRNFQLSLAGQRALSVDIVRAFEAILRELRQPQSGSPMLIAAHVRIVLVSMLRISGVEAPAMRGRGEKSGVLQRFRQLVEMHFRDHWTVARYAGTLGISRDRLHAMCTASLGKGPKALIAERLAREAGLRLERSTLTIEQLSHSLGFRDPAHFSHFFKRTTGLTPGQYRRMMASSDPETIAGSPASFADWP